VEAVVGVVILLYNYVVIMHIGGSTIDILTIIFVMLLLIFAYNSDNGFSLLILSELCWATLYTIYTLYGILFIVSTTNVISIFILVLAGVDCGI